MVRVTAHFFMIGAALLTAQISVSALERPSPIPLDVTVPSQATDDEIREAVDEAILVEEGLRLGWHLTDPVIRRFLVRNMRFLDGEALVENDMSAERERQVFERSLELGMHRTDPVVRRRLVMRARRAIVRRARRTPPTEAELEAFLQAHHERFARPGRVRFSQVFLSRQRRGRQLDDDARRLGEQLEAESITPEAGYRLGDPSLLFEGPRGRPATVSVTDLELRYGRGFGTAISEAPLERWSGPHSSSYGLHFVWLHERTEASSPDLSVVRQQVREAYLNELVEPEAVAEHLRRLRSRYSIRVQREHRGDQR